MKFLYPYASRSLAAAIVAAAMLYMPAVAHAGDMLFTGSSGDCDRYFATYEKKFQIPQHLLKAISIQESGKWKKAENRKVSWPWTLNAEGKGYYFPTKYEAIKTVERLKAQGVRSMDVGCMQVNLRYHPDAFRNLQQAFDPKYNVAYAAYLLRQHYDTYKSWDRAVASYHSKTPVKGNLYARSVRQIWHKERTVQKQALFEGLQRQDTELALNTFTPKFPPVARKPLKQE